MGFGYRVYRFELTRGPRERRRLDFSDPVGFGPYSDHLGRVLDYSGQVLIGRPNLEHPEAWVAPLETIPQEPQLRINGMDRVGPNWYLLDLDYGFGGEFDFAMGSEEDVDLAKLAPAGAYRALILMPAYGTAGRMIVETAGSRCPADMLIAWLTYCDRERGGTNYVRPRANQMGDRARVERMMRQASKVEVVLRSSRPGRAGRKREYPIKLLAQVDAPVQFQGLRDRMLTWLEGGGQPDDVHVLETIAGLSPSDLPDAGLHFDSGGVTVTDPDGKSRTYRPDTIRDKFTYELTQDAPMPDSMDWVRSVTTRARTLLSEGTDIQW